ncbi:MAG: hypothetical protein HC824_13115 [Synechococcales cyanobacterium RM1_1_8]|nr:hypothetical protein [Synechococcales cyanobacterium RM1_1_8]
MENLKAGDSTSDKTGTGKQADGLQGGVDGAESQAFLASIVPLFPHGIICQDSFDGDVDWGEAGWELGSG